MGAPFRPNSHATPQRPRAQTESDLFDVAYARCGDPAAEKVIEEQIPKLMGSLTPVAPDLARGNVTLGFYEKVEAARFFGIATTTERQYWEQWNIRLIVNTQPRAPARSESEGTRVTIAVSGAVCTSLSQRIPCRFVTCCTYCRVGKGAEASRPGGRDSESNHPNRGVCHGQDGTHPSRQFLVGEAADLPV